MTPSAVAGLDPDGESGEVVDGGGRPEAEVFDRVHVANRDAGPCLVRAVGERPAERAGVVRVVRGASGYVLGLDECGVRASKAGDGDIDGRDVTEYTR